MKESVELVCVPTSMKNIVAGSTRMDGDCGHDVWVSPASRSMIDTGKIDSVICVTCATEKMQEPGEPDEFMVHTDSLREAFEHIHRN